MTCQCQPWKGKKSDTALYVARFKDPRKWRVGFERRSDRLAKDELYMYMWYVL